MPFCGAVHDNGAARRVCRQGRTTTLHPSGQDLGRGHRPILTEHNIDPEDVALGYRNTVTGEDFLNGDTYLVAGGMYKVPLNMIYTEKIHNGEMTMDDTIAGVKYSKLLEWTIINSDNDMAKLLWKNLGTYRHYRELIAPYMGEDAETVDAKFYENNFCTARQMIHCLNLLETEKDNFPGLIDVMLKAEPKNYFKFHEQEYEVAHKYGYLVDGSKLYMNDCAIVYTDDPIVIVMFTDTLKNGYVALTDYCDLMSDYAQYHTAIRRVQGGRGRGTRRDRGTQFPRADGFRIGRHYPKHSRSEYN